jgi:hypothetical protein
MTNPVRFRWLSHQEKPQFVWISLPFGMNALYG